MLCTFVSTIYIYIYVLSLQSKDNLLHYHKDSNSDEGHDDIDDHDVSVMMFRTAR